VDLLIRTGGEQRLGDFLLWESAYAELVFTDVLWPDFSEADLASAVQALRLVIGDMERTLPKTGPTCTPGRGRGRHPGATAMSRHIDSYEGPTGDSVLVRLLYPAPAERRPGAIIGWWEKRRLPYNLIVGTSGLMTLCLNTLVHGLPNGPDGTLAVVVAFGVMANVAYTLGSVVEVAVHRLWGNKLLPMGPFLFRQGVLFSVGLTFVLPAIILTVGAIAKLLGWAFAG
jgi:hypothetical protein